MKKAKTRQDIDKDKDKTRQDQTKARPRQYQDNTRHEKGPTRQDHTRQDKTTQHKTSNSYRKNFPHENDGVVAIRTGAKCQELTR